MDENERIDIINAQVNDIPAEAAGTWQLGQLKDLHSTAFRSILSGSLIGRISQSKKYLRFLIVPTDRISTFGDDPSVENNNLVAPCVSANVARCNLILSTK